MPTPLLSCAAALVLLAPLLEVGREHHEDVEGQAEDLRDRGDAVLDQRDAEELLDDGDEGLAGAEDRAAVLQHAEHLRYARVHDVTHTYLHC